MRDQLDMLRTLPPRVLRVADQVAAAQGSTIIPSECGVWRRRAVGWMERYRTLARREPTMLAGRLDHCRRWLRETHDDDPARREWIRVAMMEIAIQERL